MAFSMSLAQVSNSLWEVPFSRDLVLVEPPESRLKPLPQDIGV